MFGKNLKYVLVLGALAVLAFTSPAVLDAISSGMAYTQQAAAAGDILKQGRPGFGFGDLFKVEARDNRIASSSIRRDFASTTRPMMLATSTRPAGEKPEGKDQKHPLTPEQVVTILFKAGIIPQEKLDLARKLINGAQMGTSTVGKVIREEVKDMRQDGKNKLATSTRMMPPPPPLPPINSSTTTM